MEKIKKDEDIEKRTEYIVDELCPYCGSNQMFIEYGRDIEHDMTKVCVNCQKFIKCPMCHSPNVGYHKELNEWNCGDCCVWLSKEEMNFDFSEYIIRRGGGIDKYRLRKK